MRRGSVVIAALAVAVAVSAIGVAPGPARAVVVRPAPESSEPSAITKLGERWVHIPGGRHPGGSTPQAMNADLSVILVQSGSDLTAPPDSQQAQNGYAPGIFRVDGLQVTRMPCPLCTAAPGVSEDGRIYVGNTAHPMVAHDTDGRPDLYLFEPGGIHLLPEGRFEGMTDDGQHVVLDSGLAHVPEDTDHDPDLYRWSRATGQVQLVTNHGSAYRPELLAMASDGSRILWRTGISDGPILEWQSGHGVRERGEGIFHSASEDLERVYFSTYLAHDPKDTDTNFDAYVHDGTGYHSMLEPSPSGSTLIDVNSDGSAWVALTGERLTPADTDTASDAYVIRGDEATLISQGDQHVGHVMVDASFGSAIYTTRGRLDPGDVDEWDDVYRWDSADPGSAQLISGFEQSDVYLTAYAADGSRAFLQTYAALVPDDTDGMPDLYEWTMDGLRLLLPQASGVPNQIRWTPDLERIATTGVVLPAEDTNHWNDVAILDFDTAPPSVTPPAPSFSAGVQVGTDGRVPVRLLWSATDSVSGPVRYELRQRGTDGVWRTVNANLTRPSATLSLAIGGVHKFAVRGWDRAGNVSDYAVAPAFALSGMSEANAAIRYTGTWTSTRAVGYWGDGVRYATQAGARAAFTFSGRSVALVSTMAPTRGQVQVRVDGRLVATVDLHAATFRSRQVVWSQRWATAARHTVELRVVGTVGRQRFDLDGWIVAS